jgi:integrase/recombinase XerD
VKLTAAIEIYVAEMKRAGQMRSRNTELAYRQKLHRFADEVGNRDPRTISRDEIRRFLGHWPHQNSQRQAHAILASFFDFALEEGWRKDNPARQVRRAKPRTPSVYHMTRGEIVQLLTVATELRKDRRRDYWLAHLGCCAGLRSQEILGLQGRHFARPGWIEVTEDLAKGAKARSIPVLKDLEPVVVEILTFTELDEYVLPGRTSLNPPEHTVHREHPHKRLSASALYKQTVALGERARLSGRLTPHCLRRGFAEHVARSAGLRVAQALLGHANVETTTLYTERPSLDELAVSIQGFSFYPASKEVETHHDIADA